LEKNRSVRRDVPLAPNRRAAPAEKANGQDRSRPSLKAFSGEVDAGSPQKMRQTKDSRTFDPMESDRRF
jgi:hypothetical protein